MKKTKLVQQLRQMMQRDTPHIPITRFSDQQVIDYFRICPGCQAKIISDAKLPESIDRVANAMEWLAVVDMQHEHLERRAAFEAMLAPPQSGFWI